MHKRPTKKQLLIRRIIFSVIATFAVVIILTATIFFLLGYRLDSGNGRLEQGALLQYDSTPNSADIYMDGNSTGLKTAGKQTVVAGIHTILFKKDKYEDWSRRIDFAAGTLTWLDYARMVPKQRTPEVVAHLKTIVGAKASPDNKYTLLQEASNQPVFQMADLRSADVKMSTLTLPTTLYSDPTTVGVTHAFTMDEWNDGGRYILVKHVYSDQTEWLMVDTQNLADSINITKLLNVNLKTLHFAGTNGRTLFGLDADGNIRKLDLSSATISRGLVNNVESFDVYDTNTISYIAVTDKRVAGIYRDGDDSPHVLRQVESLDSVLRIAVGRYFGDDYVAISEGNTVSILKGSYQTTNGGDMTSLKDFATMELSGSVTQLSFSPQSDYVLAQSGAAFMSYEIEHTRAATGSIDSSNEAAATPLQWLDASHVWNRQSNQLIMRDFDNNNIYSINAITGDFDVTLSQNGRYFYSVGIAGDGFALQRVKMILD